MKLLPWDALPPELQIPAVRKYYDILAKKRGTLLCKRILDVAAALVLLVVLAPVFLVLALAIKLESPGPVFYRQVRVTQYGRHFRIHKFRTMVQDADKQSQLTVAGDQRITRVGRWIRRCRLDEIPQLLDILAGDVTLVGVRPESPRYVAAYTEPMLATLLLPAGVTSLASIYYKDEAVLLDGAEDVDQVYVEKILPGKMYYNLKGMAHISLWGDIRVLFMTVLAVLGKEYKGDYQEAEKVS